MIYAGVLLAIAVFSVLLSVYQQAAGATGPAWASMGVGALAFLLSYLIARAEASR